MLDTHVVHWLASEPRRLSKNAADAIAEADELVVASITWLELAHMAVNERIIVSSPVRTWLQHLATEVRTLGITPEIAATAAALPTPFPRDPSDRLIYATAIEHGLRLVTRDERLRAYQHPREVTIW